MDIGLHLLGGDPLGFYRQPREMQVDLLAYWRLLNERDGFRWVSSGPARLGDLAAFGLRAGLVDVLAGAKAWLRRAGVRFADDKGRGVEDRAKHALQIANAKRVGASKKAVDFWFGGA